MKIICIGHNYSDHIKGLSNKTPENPVFFMKPDTALLRNNEDFYIPEFSNEINYEIELVVKIDRVTKAIDRKFAHRCYSEIGVGIDFTAHDLIQKCKENGLPWEIAKSFDKSAPLSARFIPIENIGGDINNINFELKINGETRQKSNSKDMINDIDTIIEYVSKFVTLKIGDLIFTGTPSGVGQVKIGDRLEAYIENDKLMDFNIK